MDSSEVKTRMMAEEGRDMNRGQNPGAADMRPKDPEAELRNLTGTEFDRNFALKMQEGHRKLIQKVQDAQSQVRNQDVREFLEKTLKTLREHETMAGKLVDQTQNNPNSTGSTSPNTNTNPR